MRWIFLSLVVLNLLAFGWGVMFGGGSVDAGANAPRTAASAYRDAPAVVLLSERGGAATKAPTPSPSRPVVDVEISPRAAPAASQQTAEGKPLCEMVGPFESAEVASDFVERLTAIEVKAAVSELELPAGPGYWVYLAPEANRQAALRRLREIQARGVDSYVIPKGDLANGISLGMFSKRELADARMDEMTAIGLQPKIQEIERSYREIWVALAHGENAKMSEITWQRLMDGLNELQRRQNFCLAVASQ